jgi:hypothetical protein
MKHNKTIMYTLFGLSMMLITNIAIAQGPNQYIAGQQGPSGGTGGYYCNTTGLGGRLLSVTVRSGAYIDGIILNYDNKADPSHIVCAGAGGSPRTLTLRPGEYIVRVMGKYNKFVEYLYIQTAGVASPQYLEFGNKNTTAQGYFDYQAVEGTIIANLIVKGAQYVDAIGVIIQKK